MNRTLRQYLNDGAEFYKSLSMWEFERAENAKKDESRQTLMKNASFNEGRSKAYLEVLELLDDYVG